MIFLNSMSMMSIMVLIPCSTNQLTFVIMGELSGEQQTYELLINKHIKYCIRCLQILPQACEYLDSNRLIIAFFAISGLDLLNGLSELNRERQDIIEWLYSLQVLPDASGENEDECGFRGTTTCSVNNNQNIDVCDKAHITSTYTALATLVILGDDLSRVDRKNIAFSLRKLQLPNGSFRPMSMECENDMRFVYSAACICYILQDWSGMDIEKTFDFIKRSVNYDGGIGQAPGLESHAGSTFCAVASLHLMGKFDTAFSSQELKSLKRWLAFRQCQGLHGRPNKPDDTCYSFWVGASLKLLDCYNFISNPELSEFVLAAQDEIVGGIGKSSEINPDLLHTYLGISGLTLKGGDDSLSVVFPALNISQRAVDYLHELHKQWDMAR